MIAAVVYLDIRGLGPLVGAAIMFLLAWWGGRT